MVEVEVATASLDERDMVCDFAEIKRVVKGWLDRELDHRMILRRDDPLVALLRGAGEPVYLVDDNPTAECLARLIYEQMHSAGLSVSRVTLWETPSSSATYSRLGRPLD
jgi:6-pyruvoyltetrahydropterin/6-carboxytetrahydropterin synthase